MSATENDPRATARAYLREQLGPRAPETLQHLATFDEQVLEPVGRVDLFAFELLPTPAAVASGASQDPAHYVFVGETEPNFYPAYGLTPEQAYSLHLGTVFGLTLGMAVEDAQQEPADARQKLETFIQSCNPGIAIEDLQLAELLRCDEQLFGVYRVRLGGQAVYCTGIDCPPGFYKQIDLPPQVILRLHVGQLLRVEARQDAELEASRPDPADPRQA